MNRQAEARIEQRLGIHTCGDDESRADRHHNAYQPTDYRVLERLAASGFIGRNDLLIDYGCGKGRVSVYMAYKTGCRSIGVEYDERVYRKALENLPRDGRVRFVHAAAESFSIPPDANRFYFFNPFSAELLNAVTARILTSYYEAPRDMRIFSYFPVPEYIACLDAAFERIGEIDCRDLFDGHDEREKILIYHCGGAEQYFRG